MGGIGQYHTLSELIGTKVVISELLQALARIPRSDVLRCLAGLATLISRETSHSPQEQLKLLHRFAPEDVAVMVQNALVSRQLQGAIFFRRQIWFVWQMALIACKDDSTMLHTAETQHQVGLCCLMASEVLKDVENVQAIDPDEAKTLGFAVTTLISLSDAVLGSEVIARCQLFWLEMHEDEDIKRLISRLHLAPIKHTFEKSYGVPLEEFIRFSYLLYYKFAESTLHDPPSALMFDSTQAFQGYFAQEHIVNSLKVLSTTPDNLAARLFGTPRQSWSLDSTVILKSPLLELAENKYVCLDLHIYRAFLVQGIFELLADAVGYDEMKQVLGGLFERYIDRIMLNFSPKSKLIATPYFNKTVFALDNTQEACDGLLVWPSFAVLLECKTNMLTTRQRYAMNLADTMKGINDQIATFSDPGDIKSKRRKGIGQLAFNLHRIISGEQIRSAGQVIDLLSVPKLHPAVVLYDDDLVNHAVRIHLNNEIIKWFEKYAFDRSRLGQTLLFSLKDIEYFEMLTENHSAEEVMREYIHFVEQHPTEIQSMFHEFTLARYPNEVRSDRGYALQTTNRVLRELQAELSRRKERK